MLLAVDSEVHARLIASYMDLFGGLIFFRWAVFSFLAWTKMVIGSFFFQWKLDFTAFLSLFRLVELFFLLSVIIF